MSFLKKRAQELSFVSKRTDPVCLIFFIMSSGFGQFTPKKDATLFVKKEKSEGGVDLSKGFVLEGKALLQFVILIAFLLILKRKMIAILIELRKFSKKDSWRLYVHFS